jgi:hypothetical protein
MSARFEKLHAAVRENELAPYSIFGGEYPLLCFHVKLILVYAKTAGLKNNCHLSAQHQRVFDCAAAAWPDDILYVRCYREPAI